MSCAHRARLLSVSSPHAAAWLTVTPSVSLGLHLDPNELHTAIKWWLGLCPYGATDVPTPLCALCPEKALDPLCHHSITCKHGSDVTNGHNRLRNTIFSACQRASLPARLEVGCGLGSSELRTRPADILVSSWGVKDTAAFDITVTSPLSPKIVSEVGASAEVAAKASESRKHEQNDTKCSELGSQCIPLAVETYRAWGEEACNAFSCIAMHEAILTNCSKSHVLGDLYGRLSIVLVRANARAILARSLQVAGMQVDAMDY